MRVTACYLYPVKSCAAVAVDRAMVEPRGLRGDRRWMIVDEDHRFLTGRQFPRMTLIVATPVAGGLHLSAPGMSAIEVAVPVPQAAAIVQVWKQQVGAAVASPEACEWVSAFLGTRAKLVHMPDTVERPVDPAYARSGDIVGYADSFPVMLIGQGSLDQLNSRLQAPVPMIRFRPNLVADTSIPHAEDAWTRIAIGEIEFDVAKACTRCNFVNVDPATGERSASGEPLKTLTTYRRFDIGVTFGRHLIPRSYGQILPGDRIEVLATV